MERKISIDLSQPQPIIFVNHFCPTFVSSLVPNSSCFCPSHCTYTREVRPVLKVSVDWRIMLSMCSKGILLANMKLCVIFIYADKYYKSCINLVVFLLKLKYINNAEISTYVSSTNKDDFLLPNLTGKSGIASTKVKTCRLLEFG